jgi:serine O-acetyltransferase
MILARECPNFSTAECDMKCSLSKYELKSYLSHQIGSFFPDGKSIEPAFLALGEALERLEECINMVRLWPVGEFNHLHSSQYCIFLYMLARVAWEQGCYRACCDKLFALNKALNGIDLFYEISMPRYFFIGHSVGIVLAKASYSDYLVLYQNSTIGKNHGKAPRLGEGAILYPNSAVIGDSETGANTVIAQGASLIDQSCPGGMIVFKSNTKIRPLMKRAKRRYIEDYFKI